MSYGGLGFEGGFCGSLGGGVAVAWDLKEGFGDSLGVRVTVAWDLKGFLWWLAAASGSRLCLSPWWIVWWAILSFLEVEEVI